jgi:hypothetical protein
LRLRKNRRQSLARPKNRHLTSRIIGQKWKSTTHIDCVGRFFDTWLDDEQVRAKGKFLI